MNPKIFFFGLQSLSLSTCWQNKLLLSFEPYFLWSAVSLPTLRTKLISCVCWGQLAWVLQKMPTIQVSILHLAECVFLSLGFAVHSPVFRWCFLGRRFCCPTGSAVVESFYQFSIILFEKLHAIMLLVLILISVVVVAVGWGRVVSSRESSYGRTKRNMPKW